MCNNKVIVKQKTEVVQIRQNKKVIEFCLIYEFINVLSVIIQTFLISMGLILEINSGGRISPHQGAWYHTQSDELKMEEV